MTPAPTSNTSSQKTFETILMLDWKRGKFRALSKRPRNVKPTEIPIRFTLKVLIPKEPEVIAHGEIVLSEAKTSEIVVEEI